MFNIEEIEKVKIVLQYDAAYPKNKNRIDSTIGI